MLLIRGISPDGVCRTSDTRYFTDPSIAAASLGLGSEDLQDDPNTFGLMFETLISVR